VLPIHEDPSARSAEPIFSTSALHKCFHLRISLALTSSSSFLLQVGFSGVCECLLCEQPFTLRRAAESSQSERFPGRRTDHGNRSEGCLLERPFVPSSMKTKKLLRIPRGPTLCSRHLYSYKNYNVIGTNSEKQQQLISLQLPCSSSAPANS